MASARRPAISLHRLGVLAVVIFSLVAAGDAAVLVASSHVVSASMHDVEGDSRAVDATNELDRILHEHHRLGRLWSTNAEPDIEITLAELERELRQLMDEMKSSAARSGDPEQQRLSRQLEQRVATYLKTHDAVLANKLPFDQDQATLRPPFERALATNAALGRWHQRGLTESRNRAARALRLQTSVAFGSAVLLVAGLLVVALAARRLILKPISSLQQAVRRFRSGEIGERPSAGILAETRELADQFNEMTETILQQRRDQLVFLAAVAHDLRNPLSALKVTVHSFRRDPNQVTAERLARLDRQLDRLERMVGDLLDATRIESGQLELRLEDIDLRDPARAVVELYAPTTSTHRITLRVPEEPVRVRGDPLRIEQAAGNLLNNAIKYSPEGGPVEVTVSVRTGWAELSVTDHGVGIPESDLQDLFLPFRRRAGTAELTHGVGLGLSIARRIACAHGGEIDVESTPNVGSTFCVRLPLASSGDSS